MPRGDKSAYTDKQKRKARHIEQGYEDRGVPREEAESRAWATVNKESGGGNKSGSGRGKPDTHVSSSRGGRAHKSGFGRAALGGGAQGLGYQAQKRGRLTVAAMASGGVGALRGRVIRSRTMLAIAAVALACTRHLAGRGRSFRPGPTRRSRAPAALALLQTLNADLLSHDSATLTLDGWCARRALAPAGSKIVAERLTGQDKPATPDGAGDPAGRCGRAGPLSPRSAALRRPRAVRGRTIGMSRRASRRR